MPAVRPAAAIIVTRGTFPDAQVLLVRRNPKLRFMGGYWAFPGGTLIREDSAEGDADPEPAFLRCAFRELFEETGILAGGMAAGMEAAARKRLRMLMLDSADVWVGLLKSGAPDYRALTPVCSLTTPPFAPLVYETRFFQLSLDDRIEPEVLTGELTESGFFHPREAVENWCRGKLDLAPPVLFLLNLMAGSDWTGFTQAVTERTAGFRTGAFLPVYFVPGIFMAPLRTPTLPPATTTNCFIIGKERLYLLEPATPDIDEQNRLYAVMDEMISTGKKFEAILLTHHHPDHVGAVTAVSRRYNLPVRAHQCTYARIPDGYIRGIPLRDGERIALGAAPDGMPDWYLEVMHTPGHAVDHLCFLESRYQSALVGDMLSTVSTIIIDPPEGHMRTYLNSLERLLARPIKTVFPAHGPAHPDGHACIRKLLDHRRAREQKIMQALGTSARTIEDLLPEVYADTAPAAHFAAARSLLAGLIKLKEEGACVQRGNGWLLST